MRKSLVLLGLIMVVVMSVAAVSPVSAAVTVDKQVSGKGAIAQWYIDATHTINAVVSISNNEKVGWVYVTISHPRSGVSVVSEASGPAEVQWSIDQNTRYVTVEATLTFTALVGNARTGTHDILITWEAVEPTSKAQLNVDTEHGMTIDLNGAYIESTAQISLDPVRPGYHNSDSYKDANFAAITHGNAAVSMTMP